MLKQSAYFPHNIDIAWKTFVRESGDVPALSAEPTNRRRLNFQGDEAKKVYEEIVKETDDVTVQLDQKCRSKSRAPTNRGGERTRGNRQGLKEKVTINAILKAVEQRDLMFLSRHVTRENVNSTDDFGWTPLMSAAYCGHFDVIEFLLSLGANRKAREKSGLTAAQLALKKNYLNIVALLRKRSECCKALTDPDTIVLQANLEDSLQIGSEFIEPSKDSTDPRNDDTGNERSNENGGFYCEICKVQFYQTTWKKHETSTLHIFNSKPKLTNAMYGISKQNKGYQMLLNHGWDEQTGLGPSGKGMKYPIKTCLKSDRKGLGQSNEKDYRVTHFKPGDPAAINELNSSKPKCLKKKDREKLLNRDVRKERALRIALA